MECAEIVLRLCNSSLLATLVGVIVGSCIFSKLQDRRLANIETIRRIIGEVEAYRKMALRYWSDVALAGKAGEKRIYETLMKNEPDNIGAALRRVSEGDPCRQKTLLMRVRKLKKAATGGEFECVKIDEGKVSERMQLTAVAAGNLIEDLYVQVHGGSVFNPLDWLVKSGVSRFLKALQKEGI